MFAQNNMIDVLQEHSQGLFCVLYLACTTMGLHSSRSRDDLPTVFSGVEQDMNA